MCSTTKTRVNVASETCRPKRVAADGRRVPRAHGWDRTRPVVTSAARRRYDAMPLARPSNQLIGCGPPTESRTSKAAKPSVAAPAMTASARPITASGEGAGRASDIAAPPDHHRVQLGGRPDRPVLLDPRRGELEALGPRADLGRAGQEQGLTPDLRPRGIRGHGRHGHQTVAARAAGPRIDQVVHRRSTDAPAAQPGGRGRATGVDQVQHEQNLVGVGRVFDAHVPAVAVGADAAERAVTTGIDGVALPGVRELRRGPADRKALADPAEVDRLPREVQPPPDVTVGDLRPPREGAVGAVQRRGHRNRGRGAVDLAGTERQRAVVAPAEQHVEDPRVEQAAGLPVRPVRLLDGPDAVSYTHLTLPTI